MRGYNSLAKQLQKANTILIIGHQNSDPDAVCSAYALSVLARKLNRKINVAFTSPEGVSKLSKQILSAVPLEITDEHDLSLMDLVITVDTNTLQQLGAMRDSVVNSRKPLIMIDHHAPHPENTKMASLVICDEKSTSTCEVILDIYEKLRVHPDRRVNQALLIGLLVETGHLSIATRRTFESACSLIRGGADPEKALALARTSMDESERIARVRSAQRVRLEKVNSWLVALSEVGSYHASAARGLVALGAHVAVVAGRRNDQLTVSFRSTRDFLQGTGLHLGTDLAKPLGERMGGSGGGHATAAGANAKGEVNEALRLALAIVREFVSRALKANTNASGYAGTSSQSRVITQK